MNRGWGAGVAALTLGSVLALAGPASAASSATFYANCTQAANAGATNIRRGQPGYRSALDRDNDGIACETGNGESTNSSTSSFGGGSVAVNSGSGGGADRVSTVAPIAVGGLGLVVLGGSAAALNRRRAAISRRG